MDEPPRIKIPSCHCRREAVLYIRKRKGESIYKISCCIHGGGMRADTIDKALVVWSEHNDAND